MARSDNQEQYQTHIQHWTNICAVNSDIITLATAAQHHAGGIRNNLVSADTPVAVSVSAMKKLYRAFPTKNLKLFNMNKTKQYPDSSGGFTYGVA